MRFEFELTDEDLLQITRLVVKGRQQRLTHNPLLFLFAVAIGGTVGWPLWAFVTADGFGLNATSRAGLYAGMVFVAAAIALALRRRLPLPRSDGMAQWVARRNLSASRARSVMGPVRIELTPDGLTRKNTTGELTVRFPEVTRLMLGEGALALLLTGRVLLIPARAFVDDAQREAVAAQLEQATGRPLQRVIADTTTSA